MNSSLECSVGWGQLVGGAGNSGGVLAAVGAATAGAVETAGLGLSLSGLTVVLVDAAAPSLTRNGEMRRGDMACEAELPTFH